MLRNVRNSILNSKMKIGSNIATSLHGADALDKRNSDSFKGVTDLFDTVNDISSMFSGALGIKSPYLTIGEVPNNNWLDTSTYGQLVGATGAVGSAVRAVQGIIYGEEQQGVVIDCLGDVTGESSVDFTTNPLMYITNGVIDSRIRQPAKVNATVGISNYLADDILGDLLNVGTSAIGNIGSGVVNQLLNGGSTRAQAALYRLRWIMENGRPFTVYTPHGIYENMLIKSIKPRTTDSSMDMLYADIEFQEAILYSYYRSDSAELKKGSVPMRTGIEETGNTTVTGTISKVSKKVRGWL